MIVRLLLSVLLAFAPSAQAGVVGARIVVAPAGSAGLAPVTAPQLTRPTFSFSGPSAPMLSAPLAAPGLTPAPSAVMAARLTAVSPVAAVAARVIPAAHAPERPGDEPAKAREVRVRFDELKAAFDEKKPEDVDAGAAKGENLATLTPSDLAPHAKADEPPQPPSEPKGRNRFGFSRPLAFFLVALVLAQVGLEAQTAGLPPLIAKVFGNVGAAADVGMAGSIADLAGTVLAPIAAKRLGLKKGYLLSTGARVVTSGLIAGLLAANLLSMTGLLALFAVDALLYGVSYTLEKSIPAVMVNQDQAKLEKFKAARQTAIEAVATIVPIATGAAVAAFGFLPALFAFPLAMAGAMTIIALTLKLPAKFAALDGTPLPGPEEGSTVAYFKHLGRGAAAVARTPALLFSLLSYAFVYAPTMLVYWLLAPAFALHLAGDAAHATAYAGMITGLYSLGGIVGAVFVMRQQRKNPDAAKMRKSMLRWTAATAAAMLLFGALALPAVAWGTLTLPALALLAFGIPQVVARLKLESYFQSKAPKGSVDDATAVLEGAASIVIAAGLWWFGKMLAGAHIVSAAWLAAAAAPLMLGLLVLTWALARASKRA